MCCLFVYNNYLMAYDSKIILGYNELCIFSSKLKTC